MEDVNVYHHRADRDDFIRHLAERFPKTFFEEPSLRRPLKLNILSDLEQQNVLDHDKLEQTLTWYCGHYTYNYALTAGATRIDLDGNKAGTVTAAEQQEALAYIKTRKQEIAERQETMRPVAPAVPALTAIKQIHARAAVSDVVKTTPSLHPTLAKIQEAIGITNNFLTEKQYEPLREKLVTTVLKEITRHADQLIGELAANNQEPQT
jgi:sRNA-binding protein